MSYKRIWEDDTFRSSGGKGYFDHELVRAAAKGECDEVKRLMKIVGNVRADLETLPGGPDPGIVVSKIGTVVVGPETATQEQYKYKTNYVVLHAASLGGHDEIVELVLDKNADAINEQESRVNGWTVLQAAALGGYESVVKLLLKREADINAPGSEESGRTALQAAAGAGHEELVKILLEHGAKLGPKEHISDFKGRTALQAAAEGGHIKVVQLLLDKLGRRIKNAEGVSEWHGRTAFQAAAGAGRKEVVQLLLKRKANTVNTPPGGENGGRTALQAAAEGGHLEMVKTLLEQKADIKHAASYRNGRTAFQAAAGAGHEDVVHELLQAYKRITGKDGVPVDLVNEPSGFDRGRTALQAAVEGKHERMVQQLLDMGAEINAPPSDWTGLTALQAAAEGGNAKMVELLLRHGADVNAPASSCVGTLALEAAAKGGHEEIVKVLIEAGADVNARGENGGNALKAAADRGNMELMSSLLNAGAEVYHDSVDCKGQNLLHHACQGEYDYPLMSTLIKRSKPQTVNAMDDSGSTPLHIAVKGKKLDAVELLLEINPNKEIQDNSGNTPLEVALEDNLSSMVTLLLKKGASTDKILTSEYPKLAISKYTDKSNDCILISDDPQKGRTIEATTWEKRRVLDEGDLTKLLTCTERSMFFQHESNTCTVDPSSRANRIYIFPKPVSKQGRLKPDSVDQTMVQWKWLSCTESAKPDSVKWTDGIPDNRRMLSLNHSSVILVGNTCFDWSSHEDLHTSAAAPAPAPTSSPPTETELSFESGAQKVEISLIMRKENENTPGESSKYMKFIYYRCSFPLKTFALPPHGAEFVTWFMRNVNDRWMELIDRAKPHLAQRRGSQLSAAGRSRTIILGLLKDSQEWNRLRGIWREHLKRAKELKQQFNDYDILRGEWKLHGADASTPPSATTVELSPIYRLWEEVKFLEERCGDALSKLDTETKELIQLEFSLVSIHEARSSIEMAKDSNEMARSMKRLSWITFIFLPLMFIAGLFGMNVNVLSDNPAWQWYFVVAGPFSILVVFASILCKHPKIVTLMTKIDDHLTSTFLAGGSRPLTTGAASNDSQATIGTESDSEADNVQSLGATSRRAYSYHNNDLESASPVKRN